MQTKRESILLFYRLNPTHYRHYNSSQIFNANKKKTKNKNIITITICSRRLWQRQFFSSPPSAIACFVASHFCDHAMESSCILVCMGVHGSEQNVTQSKRWKAIAHRWSRVPMKTSRSTKFLKKCDTILVEPISNTNLMNLRKRKQNPYPRICSATAGVDWTWTAKENENEKKIYWNTTQTIEQKKTKGNVKILVCMY